jgi:hypothetical protein
MVSAYLWIATACLAWWHAARPPSQAGLQTQRECRAWWRSILPCNEHYNIRMVTHSLLASSQSTHASALYLKLSGYPWRSTVLQYPPSSVPGRAGFWLGGQGQVYVQTGAWRELERPRRYALAQFPALRKGIALSKPLAIHLCNAYRLRSRLNQRSGNRRAGRGAQGCWLRTHLPREGLRWTLRSSRTSPAP